MRWHRLLLGTGIAGLAILLGVAALRWWLADGITPANAARIRPGMALESVNRLLGQQGRVTENKPMPAAAGENHYVWEGSLGAIHVAFRGDLTATDPAEFTPLDSIQAHLRRLLP